MASIFNLWNLYFLDESKCEFDISAANLPKMNSGSADFISECLQALNVSSPAESWNVTPSRAHYFTDYTSSKEAWGASRSLEPPR